MPTLTSTEHWHVTHLFWCHSIVKSVKVIVACVVAETEISEMQVVHGCRDSRSASTNTVFQLLQSGRSADTWRRRTWHQEVNECNHLRWTAQVSAPHVDILSHYIHEWSLYACNKIPIKLVSWVYLWTLLDSVVSVFSILEILMLIVHRYEDTFLGLSRYCALVTSWDLCLSPWLNSLIRVHMHQE